MFIQRKIVLSRSALIDILTTAALAACLVSLYAATISRSGNLPVISACLGVGAALSSGWLVRRGFVDRARLPRTGVEIWLGLFLAGALLSMLFSAYPRIGLERFGWFLFLSMLFFALLDLMEQPRLRLQVQAVLLAFTGLAILLALMETYGQYLVWWWLAGSQSIMPPHPYRFVSVILQSNVFMSLVNMFAPLALLLFLTAKRRTGRVLGALWLVMYAAAAAFSSSRGGWLGAAVWLAVFAGLWLLDGGRWLRLLGWLKKRWAVGLAAGLAGILAAGYAAFKVYAVFAAANPSHGDGSTLNREWIWQIALNVWKESPVTGTGLGKLILDYLPVVQTRVDPWWPSHAHSLPLQILAETGLAGFLPFLALTITGAAALVRSYRRTPAGERMNSAAALAGLGALAVQGIFEDYTYLPLLTAAALALAASVIAAPGPLTRFSRASMGWLAAPALPVAAIAVFSLWGYAPLYRAAIAASDGRWQQAAELAAQSARRDPSLAYYHFQSAIAWAAAWQQGGDPQMLEQARLAMQRGLEIDPNSSVFWADLAALQWHSGHPGDALLSIQRAAEGTPYEPALHLHWGWILEQLGRDDEAGVQYRRAIELNPQAASHPFWQATAARREAAARSGPPAAASAGYWIQAREQIRSGDLAAARLSLAKSYYFREAPGGFALGWAEYEAASGRPQASRSYLQDLASILDERYWNFTIGDFSYHTYMGRVNFSRSVVPGFMVLPAEIGQFQALETLYQEQVSDGDCPAAARTWETLQREIHVGEWPPGGYPLAGPCPE